MHNIERPISYLAYQTAEMNRDRKKNRKAFKPEDFQYYNDQSMQNLPEPRYGAAALALIKAEMFPWWALFTYKDLAARAKNVTPPTLLCFQCEDAIVLAPSIEELSVRGMLIAGITASGKIRTMNSPCGSSITVRMPIVSGQFEANEEAELRILS